MGSLLIGTKPLEWEDNKQPLTINWNNKEGSFDLWKGENAIINSGDSLVMVDNPDQPIVPHNSKIYFEADCEGDYPFTSFHNPGHVMTLRVHDKERILSYLPKLPKKYNRDFLHQVRRWIELDNYLKDIELNSLKAPLEGRQAILNQVSQNPADEKKLHKAISDSITNKVGGLSLDPVCRVVFDTWKKHRAPHDSELLLECLVGGKVSFDRVTSIINRELSENVKARERLQHELQSQLCK